MEDGMIDRDLKEIPTHRSYGTGSNKRSWRGVAHAVNCTCESRDLLAYEVYCDGASQEEISIATGASRQAIFVSLERVVACKARAVEQRATWKTWRMAHCRQSGETWRVSEKDSARYLLECLSGIEAAAKKAIPASVAIRDETPDTGK